MATSEQLLNAWITWQEQRKLERKPKNAKELVQAAKAAGVSVHSTNFTPLWIVPGQQEPEIRGAVTAPRNPYDYAPVGQRVRSIGGTCRRIVIGEETIADYMSRQDVE